MRIGKGLLEVAQLRALQDAQGAECLDPDAMVFVPQQTVERRSGRGVPRSPENHGQVANDEPARIVQTGHHGTGISSRLSADNIQQDLPAGAILFARHHVDERVDP